MTWIRKPVYAYQDSGSKRRIGIIWFIPQLQFHTIHLICRTTDVIKRIRFFYLSVSPAWNFLKKFFPLNYDVSFCTFSKTTTYTPFFAYCMTVIPGTNILYEFRLTKKFYIKSLYEHALMHACVHKYTYMVLMSQERRVCRLLRVIKSKE